MYKIFKGNHYLTDITDWSSSWINSESSALPFWDKAAADAIAERLDACVVSYPCLN